MKIDDMHNILVNHYRKARTIKSKRGIQIQSIVGQTYKKKTKQVQENSPIQDFIRNQKHIAAEQQPLYFRTLPRKLKVYFPGPPTAPPKLQQVPYTYQIVPKVPFKMPKQKPGYVGDWILQQSGFTDKKYGQTRKNKSMIQNYRKSQKSENKSYIINIHEKRQRFRSQVKNLVKTMKQKNLSLKQIIKNKGLIKKLLNFYNSTDFFLMCRSGDKNVEELLIENPELAFDTDEQQMTGLHWAAREGHANICRLLLQKYRANCHAKDCYGRTPLHLAVENQNIQCIIRIFIEGGHLNALNNQHKSVRMVAKDAYIKYLVEKLEQIKFVVKYKNHDNKEDQRKELEAAIRSTLDQSSLYF